MRTKDGKQFERHHRVYQKYESLATTYLMSRQKHEDLHNCPKEEEHWMNYDCRECTTKFCRQRCWMNYHMYEYRIEHNIPTHGFCMNEEAKANNAWFWRHGGR